MLEAARLRPGPGFSVLKFCGYYSLRFVPFIGLRRAIARVIAFALGRVVPAPSSPATAETHASASRLLAAVTERGMTMAPALPAEHVEEMRRYLADKPMCSETGAWFTEANVPPGVRIASYPLATILACPHVFELMNDPVLLELAERYLGCRPTLSGIRIDCSFPAAGPAADVQRFHRDHDDWAFLKYFLYLTDVDDESGPHEFAFGSHNKSERFSAAPYADEDVYRKYGRDVVKITGPKGTAFYEDTWGIHRGVAPTARRRVIFQVQYSILPIFKYNYQPLPVRMPRQVDPYVNRLIVTPL